MYYIKTTTVSKINFSARLIFLNEADRFSLKAVYYS